MRQLSPLERQGKTNLGLCPSGQDNRICTFAGQTAFRGLEVAGEFGEVAEALKKYLRGTRGIKGSTADLQDVANEMADAIIALDLLADQMGIDLGAAVTRKFNATSQKYGLETRLPADD
ncbi:MazG-like family protein [Roseibium sp.]|uniref:MazG-like family protein n=1 Tax=Roseibium sp. TaxID=1936156 RepID=UPI003D13719B